MSPETPIWDIVDRCQVWESHADLEDQGRWYPSPRWPLPIFTINGRGKAGDDQPGAANHITPAAQELLESLLQHLLPTPVVLPPKVTPIPYGEVQFYRPGSIDTEFASGLAVYVGAATPGAWTPGLVGCGVFLVWQAGSCGLSVSRSGYYVSFLAAGMAGGIGGRQFCHAVTPDAG